LAKLAGAVEKSINFIGLFTIYRRNIMKGAYTRVGLAVGTHPKYGGSCVMDFAGEYVDK
jgi:hypothetical protein